MSDWNPALYRQFEAERTRPAQDLLAVVPLARVTRAVDLGCGPGNSTELLATRYPGAAITGIDSSAAMLAEARARLPGVVFQQADIAQWAPSPDQRPDLLFANAVLQWLPDHQQLLPRLLGLLAPQGVLAVQMPDNLDEPSHQLMRAVAAEGPWAPRLAGVAQRRARLPSAGRYYNLLCPAARVTLWRTTYYHRMASATAIVDWVRSTGLKPFLDLLSAEEQADFIATYQARIAEAYPAQGDGTRLLAFPRLFLVAERVG